MDSIQGSHPTPGLAVNLTITAQGPKQGKTLLLNVTISDSSIQKEFKKMTKTTLSNKAFLYTKTSKVSICHRLCGEYIKYLCSCGVLKKLPISYTAVWGEKRVKKAHPDFPCFKPRLCLPSSSCQHLCFVWGFSSSLLQFHCLHRGQTHLS